MFMMFLTLNQGDFVNLHDSIHTLSKFILAYFSSFFPYLKEEFFVCYVDMPVCCISHSCLFSLEIHFKGTEVSSKGEKIRSAEPMLDDKYVSEPLRPLTQNLPL